MIGGILIESFDSRCVSPPPVGPMLLGVTPLAINKKESKHFISFVFDPSHHLPRGQSARVRLKMFSRDSEIVTDEIYN